MTVNLLLYNSTLYEWIAYEEKGSQITSWKYHIKTIFANYTQTCILKLWTSENLLRAFYELYLFNFQHSFNNILFYMHEFCISFESEIVLRVHVIFVENAHHIFKWIKWTEKDKNNKKAIHFIRWSHSILSTVHHLYTSVLMTKCLCFKKPKEF